MIFNSFNYKRYHIFLIRNFKTVVMFFHLNLETKFAYTGKKETLKHK